MITEQEAPPLVGITPIICGIIQDAQTLLKQQLTLFQTEVKSDLRRTRDAAIPLGAGVAVAVVALGLLCLTFVYALVWIWPQLPLFAAYGIVTLVIGLVGGGLILMGKSKFDSFSPLPDKTVEGLKENIQWTTKT
jgi:uncharacterized membrane protein YqjE